MKRSLGLVAVLAVTASLLTACAPETPHFVSGSSLVIGESAPLSNLNSGVAASQASVLASRDLQALTMPAFYSTDSDGKSVANSNFGTVTSSDATTVQYKLTGRAKWSDGAVVSTADLLLSWAAATNWGQAGFSSQLAGTSLAKAKTLPRFDAKSVTLNFETFTPDYSTALPVTVAAHLIGQLAFADENLDDQAAAARVETAISNNWQNDLAKLAVAYNEALQASAGTNWDKSLIVTAGPYSVVTASATKVALKANPDFAFGPAPTVDQLTVNFYADANALASDLVAGKVDLARPIASATANLNQVAGALKSAADLAVISGFGGEAQYAIFNRADGSEFATKPDGSNAALVEAKLAATQLFLPRAGIIDSLSLIDPIERADSFVLPSTSSDYAASVKGNGSNDYRFQQAERAAELLTEAGFARRINVRVLFDSSSANGQLEFGLLARYAKVAGINLQNVSSDKPAEVLASGAWELYLTDRLSMSQDLSALALASGSVTSYRVASTVALAKTLAKAIGESKMTAAQSLALDKDLFDSHFGLPLIQLPNLLANSAKLKAFQPNLATQQVTWGYWNWLVSAPAK